MTENKKRKTGDKRKKDKNYRSQVVILYIVGFSERVDRVLKKHVVVTVMRPHTTLRHVLVHPKDKAEPEEQGELVYQIPWNSCSAACIGETGILFRLDEHKNDVENAPKEQYTTSRKKRSLSTTNTSALTDHATTENHLIYWEGAKVVDWGVGSHTEGEDT